MLIVTLGASAYLGAQREARTEATSVAKELIRQATTDLRRKDGSEPTPVSRENARASIHRVVDQIVSNEPDAGPENLRGKLQLILSAHIPEAEYGDPPSVRVMKSSVGNVVVVAYNVIGGAHDSAPTIRAYASVGGKRERLATAADEFQGFIVHSRVVKSPTADEPWLLVWGRGESFNGTLIRTRIYALVGSEFRTVWAPKDMLNATIVDTDKGVLVTHLLKDQLPWQFVRDEYVFLVDGPVMTGRFEDP